MRGKFPSPGSAHRIQLWSRFFVYRDASAFCTGTDIVVDGCVFSFLGGLPTWLIMLSTASFDFLAASCGFIIFLRPRSLATTAVDTPLGDGDRCPPFGKLTYTLSGGCGFLRIRQCDRYENAIPIGCGFFAYSPPELDDFAARRRWWP